VSTHIHHRVGHSELAKPISESILLPVSPLSAQSSVAYLPENQVGDQGVFWHQSQLRDQDCELIWLVVVCGS